MSYILNALRKSEQERRNKEPDTLQHRIAEIQPHAHTRNAKLMPALIAINVVLLGYFIWEHYRQTPGVEAPDRTFAQTADRPATTTGAGPVEAADEKAAAVEPEPVQSRPSVQGGEKRLRPEPMPVVETPKKTDPAPLVSAGPKNPAKILPKPEAVPEPVGNDSQMTHHSPIASAASVRSPEVGPGEVADGGAAPKNPPVSVEANPAPYVTELPNEVRERMPRFTINVFMYSEQASDSFVIVDMQKYKVGQLIQGQIELTEIRPDSMVVRYQDQTFKIKRP